MIELEERTETEAPPRPKTPQETLLAAARYIEEHGWCQGSWSQPDGSVCLWGALRAIVVGDHGSFSREDWEPLAERLPLGKFAAAWNDEPGRTEAEVIAALRAAAA